MRKGYIQVYTGNGKGKTTASLGLALRAAGAGLKVFIAQFIKRRKCSEHKIIEERLNDLITIKMYGKGFILNREPTSDDISAALEGYEEIKDILQIGKYDLVILDEINVAVNYNFIPACKLLEVMALKHKKVELVITGRNANTDVMRKADLVTEMKALKHYKEKGVKARKGIEC
ncbi:MAG: cob(I)yrinic acid a,c-diamide adenosyltransferase [Nitrospirae bacterium RBG_16_43_8]|nr:MAG: cob(I)yrinic acid a,c-diamide adenosyltransferase [Nitrospirae bacterium RBG_16_43_8]